MSIKNSAGIHPTGKAVLVLLDQVSTKGPEGVVALPESTIRGDQLAQIRGTLVEKGPIAWEASPKASLSPGCRVIIRKFAGEFVTGMDGVMYRIINDNDVYATFDVGYETPVLA